jgi:radical SAM superfamily enzyme YgiQ (UPF0313 family)
VQLDILLFNPPRYKSGRYHKFNNALLSLASYLHRRGVAARVVPLNDDHYAQMVRDEIESHRPRVVAVSCKWWDTLYSSTYIAELAKQVDPGILTVTGGHTASFFASELVQQTAFDVVVRGDGERPLLDLVNGERPVNCVLKGGDEPQKLSEGYSHGAENIDEIGLVDDITDIVSDPEVVNSFVWTGKGCLEGCVYCAANAWNTARSFGRRKLVYRPYKAVLADIEILSRLPGGKRITFDFDPTRGPIQEAYYLELFGRLEPKRFTAYFFSWSLPTKQLIDALAETFVFVELCIDVQTGSERLRRLLAERGLLKPFFADGELEELLQHLERHPNFIVDVSTLMGLPFERDADVEQIVEFSDRFYDRFESLRYPYVSPMNVEPGSLLLDRPDKYEMVLFRKSFDDFMAYTRRSFEQNMNCYQPEDYDDGAFHPLGVASKDSCARGEPLAAYEAWKKIQDHVDRRSAEKAMLRVRKYKQFDLAKIGIKGGTDRGSFRGSEVE